MNRETGRETGKASRAKRNMRPCCDLQTETELLWRLESLVFGREVNPGDDK
jgi:hypothetical protein